LVLNRTDFIFLLKFRLRLRQM